MANTNATLALKNLKIWDGDSVADADTMVIQGSRIAAVGDAAVIPDGAPTRDCGGLWAVPGLIDAHVHLELNPDDKQAPSGSPDRREEGIAPGRHAGAVDDPCLDSIPQVDPDLAQGIRVHEAGDAGAQ
mgnify:CR=1 FL=1